MFPFTGAWYNLLGKVVQSGEFQVVKFLVDHLSLDTNASLDGFHGHTALYVTAQYHHHDILRLLLGNPLSNVDMRNLELFGALHHVIKHNCMTAFKLLHAPLVIGLRSCRECGEIALQLARKSGKREIYQLLLSYGVVGEHQEMDPIIVDEDAHEQSCWTTQDEEELRDIHTQLDITGMEDSDIETDTEEYEDLDMSSEENGE
jgi:hypothetical protein